MADIHQIYLQSAAEMGYRCISLRTFQRYWAELCPHITIAKPATDFCQSCQQFAKILDCGGRISLEEKTSTLQRYELHLKLVDEQREYYKLQSSAAKQNVNRVTVQPTGLGVIYKVYKIIHV